MAFCTCIGSHTFFLLTSVAEAWKLHTNYLSSIPLSRASSCQKYSSLLPVVLSGHKIYIASSLGQMYFHELLSAIVTDADLQLDNTAGVVVKLGHHLSN